MRDLDAVRDYNQPVANVVWGLYWGLCGAVFYSLVAVLIHIADGPTGRTSLGATIEGYFLGGVIGGMALGMLRPITRFGWGAALTGAVVAVPVWMGGLVAVEGWTRIDQADLQMVVLVSAISGPICGLAARRRFNRT